MNEVIQELKTSLKFYGFDFSENFFDNIPQEWITILKLGIELQNFEIIEKILDSQLWNMDNLSS